MMGQLADFFAINGMLEIESDRVLTESIPYTDKKGLAAKFDLRTQVGILRRRSQRSSAELVEECNVSLPKEIAFYPPGLYSVSWHSFAVNDRGRLDYKRDMAIQIIPAMVLQLIEQDQKR